MIKRTCNSDLSVIAIYKMMLKSLTLCGITIQVLIALIIIDRELIVDVIMHDMAIAIASYGSLCIMYV